MVRVDKICFGCMNEIENPNQICPICGYHKGESEKTQKSSYLRPGTIVGEKYLLGKVLGMGGFGITYLAKNLETGDILALKEYFPSEIAYRDVYGTSGKNVSVDGSQRRRFYEIGLRNFEKEANNLLLFQNLDGIVKTKNYFQENETAYLVMEYVKGISLKAYLRKRKKPLAQKQILKMIKPVLCALEKIHKKGMIHRDISPENLIVDRSGKMTLIDFGAARMSTGDETKSLTILLKHGYAPMEQYQSKGRQGPWTDIYALCATLYESMSLQVPKRSVERAGADSLIPLKKLAKKDERIHVSPYVSDVIQKGMEIQKEDRYQDIASFGRALYQREDWRKHTKTIQNGDSLLGKEENEKSLETKKEQFLIEQKKRLAYERKKEQEKINRQKIEKERKARLQEEYKKQQEYKKKKELEREVERERKEQEFLKREYERQQEEKRRQQERLREERRKKDREESEKILRRQKEKNSIEQKDFFTQEKVSFSSQKTILLSQDILEKENISVSEDNPFAQRKDFSTQDKVESQKDSLMSKEVESKWDDSVENREKRRKIKKKNLKNQKKEVGYRTLESVQSKDTDLWYNPYEQEGLDKKVSRKRKLFLAVGFLSLFVCVGVIFMLYRNSEEIYVNFGTYPQNEITGSAITDEIKNAEYDARRFATVNGKRYRKSGPYYYVFDNIKWRVLEKKDGKVLLISDRILDAIIFSRKNEVISDWKDSFIREWLNDYFYNAAFTEEEKDAIIKSTIETDGVETEDKVFLLSTEDVTDRSLYFTTDSERIAKQTLYAVRRGAQTGDETAGRWWLRTPGTRENTVQVVRANGSLAENSYTVMSNDCGVRPAIWVEEGYFE